MTNTNTEHDWIALEVVTSAEASDAVSSFFHDEESHGVVIDEAPDERVTVTAYFPADACQSVREKLVPFLKLVRDSFPDGPEPMLSTKLVKRENWATAWQSNFEPLTVGRKLLVTPPWIKPDAAGRQIIIIEPAEAFGTGTHETTQGCMELLEGAIAAFAEAGEAPSVLDVGCGSGILAIAAAKLGAVSIRAVDNDPVAVASARKNAALNGVENAIEMTCTPLEEVVEPADIVVANIDPMTLLGHVEQLVRLARGYLVISGVPIDQWENVKEGFLVKGVRLFNEIAGREWGSGTFVPARTDART
jgi:ribosomal protein L11 methyltransferase